VSRQDANTTFEVAARQAERVRTRLSPGTLPLSEPVRWTPPPPSAQR
jgi:hypothetical protein